MTAKERKAFINLSRIIINRYNVFRDLAERASLDSPAQRSFEGKKEQIATICSVGIALKIQCQEMDEIKDIMKSWR